MLFSIIFALIIIFIIVLIIVFYITKPCSNNSTNSTNTPIKNYKKIKKLKEHYGPPPGRQRAVSIWDLGIGSSRGWAGDPAEYIGNSASALTAYIEADPSDPDFYNN